jgi:hypothetical protein
MCDHSIFDSQWLQTFIGFLLGLLSALALEFNRKPKLTVRLKGAELIAGFKHLGAEVENKPPVWWLRWFTHREAAYHATILISVIDWDGRGHFAAPIEGRWSGSPEPPDVANTAGVLSLSAAHALLFQDLYPGVAEGIDIAIRYPGEEDCYIFNNSSYRSEYPAFQNPRLRLQHNRYRIEVKVTHSGGVILKRCILRNDVPYEDFRLEEEQQ